MTGRPVILQAGRSAPSRRGQEPAISRRWSGAGRRYGQGPQECAGVGEVAEQDARGTVAEQPELVQVVLEQSWLEVVLLDSVQAAEQLQQRNPRAGPDVS